MGDCSLIKIRQLFPANQIDDVEGLTRKELEHCSAGISLQGKVIGIAIGSRGIDRIASVAAAVVSFVKSKGGRPVIIPAMGSHGGATANGQTALLNEYGINENSIGAPILASMDVIKLDNEDLSFKLYMSRVAFETDGLIVINRIKPHTDFYGKFESGLAKMCVIGLGKHAQALEIHSFGIDGLSKLIPVAAEKILSTKKVIMGLAIVENCMDKIAHIEAVPYGKILSREPELLEMARQNMPTLPVKNIDILIIDKIGKDISGVGLDPNVIGRIGIQGVDEPDSPVIKQIIVCDLTEKTQGNALGIGLADVTTRQLFEKIDFKIMYENVFTSTFLLRAKIPVIAESQKDAFKYALRACGRINEKQARIIRIRDTLHLDQLYVSQAIFQELSENGKFEAVSGFGTLFNGDSFQLF